jgi:hypothetical protein
VKERLSYKMPGNYYEAYEDRFNRKVYKCQLCEKRIVREDEVKISKDGNNIYICKTCLATIQFEKLYDNNVKLKKIPIYGQIWKNKETNGFIYIVEMKDNILKFKRLWPKDGGVFSQEECMLFTEDFYLKYENNSLDKEEDKEEDKKENYTLPPRQIEI